MAFRTNPAAPFAKGRANLLRAVCGTFGGQQRLTKLYPIGSDFDTMVLTESVNGQGTRTASLFRVQKSLITEWVDAVVEGAGPAAGQPECGGLSGREHRARTGAPGCAGQRRPRKLTALARGRAAKLTGGRRGAMVGGRTGGVRS